jgi:uncharacterized repeat protein (TIGR03803 family)
MRPLKLFAILCVAWACVGNLAHADAFISLHSFCDQQTATCPDGRLPGVLVQASTGDLYGTTLLGGSNGSGTIFKISASGTLTTLYSFCAQSGCADGQEPSGLIQAADGYLYGTTHGGGINGDGTVFKITLNGTLATLHSFDYGTDGAYPNGLMQSVHGDLYGVTASGGPYVGGTVYRITPSGTLTTLYSFCAQSECADGRGPEGTLVQTLDGDLYGTTFSGGTGRGRGGTVFKITPSGTLTTLYNFCAQGGICIDGETPENLVLTLDGSLYGMTQQGGANYCIDLGCGTVFTITRSGTLTTLYNFCAQGGCTDGSNPVGNLISVANGNQLYGTTYNGGAGGGGTVFKITPSGTLTTLYSFCSQTGCADGAASTFLVQDTNGNLFGTTAGGGAFDDGTVFSLCVGLCPFVETLPTSGEVGAAVSILGTDLTGASGVSFNGTAATFAVVTASEIKTTVPAGATTGTVAVTTPSGTLSSNKPFRVD